MGRGRRLDPRVETDVVKSGRFLSDVCRVLDQPFYAPGQSSPR